MTNHLLIGTGDKTERLLQIAKPGFLLIDDGPIADAFLERFSRAKLFDPTAHSFNPLDAIDYKRAREFASAVYMASPEGKDTLTVRNGKRALTRMLLAANRLDRLTAPVEDPGTIEALDTIADMLLSPVLKSVLCKPTNFSFRVGRPPSSVVAKIDRAMLGDFDALILASLLIGQFKGQVIVPDFGFYGRPYHASLIRQTRLIAGLNYLDELPREHLTLRQAILSIKDKTVYRTNDRDADQLKFYVDAPNPRKLIELRGNEYLSSE